VLYLIIIIRLEKPDALPDPPRIGVDDENRLPGRIEENGVGGFRTDAMKGEETIAQRY
jgi:hypothetical protein